MKYDLNINSHIGTDGLNSGIYPVLIYQLIRYCSNTDHKLTINDIEDTLSDYWKGDIEKESRNKNLRRTIKRNLETLLYFDANINASDKNNDPYYIDSGTPIGKIHYLWYEQDLSPTDLQLLSDAVVYSKHLSNERRAEILSKLMKAAGQPYLTKSEWYNNVIENSRDISVPMPTDLYRKLEYINDAIATQRCVQFTYTLHGPNNIKFEAKRYTGVSPYKILLDDGTYYMIASKHKRGAETFDDYEGAEKVLYWEIHKLDNLRLDDDSPYLPIEETIANDKTIDDFLSNGYNPYSHQAIPFRFAERVHMGASILGLDLLYDRFGERIHVKTRKDFTAVKAAQGLVPYRYEITINDVARNDWYEILILLLRLPRQDLGLTGDSQRLLIMVQKQIENRLR